MLKNLRIGTRLGIGFGLILLLLASLALSGTGRMRHLAGHATGRD
ncbi:MAG: hypothetical protein ACE5EI_03180 [Thermodesulfobacteriota bacterium]